MLAAAHLVSSGSSGLRIRKVQLSSLSSDAAATYDVAGLLVCPLGEDAQHRAASPACGGGQKI
jgi:hypothetical protein